MQHSCGLRVIVLKRGTNEVHIVEYNDENVIDFLDSRLLCFSQCCI